MSDLTLTPEEQFILACLRTVFNGSGVAGFPVFAYESFDWNRVHNKSIQWRIAPLLYKIIEKLTKSPLKTRPRGNGEGEQRGCNSLTKDMPVGQTGDSGGCIPLNPVVSAQSNEKQTVPLRRGQGEDSAFLRLPERGRSQTGADTHRQRGCQKPNIPKYFLEKIL